MHLRESPHQRRASLRREIRTKDQAELGPARADLGRAGGHGPQLHLDTVQKIPHRLRRRAVAIAKLVAQRPELLERAQLGSLRDELRDRYGAPPEPVRNLLYGVEVKLRAVAAGATEVRARGPELRLVLGADLTTERRIALVRAFPKVQAGQRQIRLSVLHTRGDWRDALTRMLELVAA